MTLTLRMLNTMNEKSPLVYARLCTGVIDVCFPAGL